MLVAENGGPTMFARISMLRGSQSWEERGPRKKPATKYRIVR
jgi:hypothetical protein